MPEPIQWTDWYARRHPGRVAFAALVIVGAVWWAGTFGWGYGLAAAIGLLAMTGEALVPLTYTLDADGLRIEGVILDRRLRWRDLSGWVRAQDGVVLLLRRRLSLRDRTRLLWVGCHERLNRVESELVKHLPQLGGPRE